jgi:DNA polymerase-3 subunit epsilon
MIDWLTKGFNKDYPQFWVNYLSKFDKKPTRFVVLSTITTGLDFERDVVLAIGAVAVQDNAIQINDSFEVVLLQYVHNHNNGFSNEFIIESKQPKLAELEAITSFIDYLENAILIGHHIDFDVEIINETLKKLNCGRLKNEALDIEVMYKKWKEISDEKQLSIDELASIFKISKQDRFSASEDAYTIALLFLKLKSRLKIN